ncbi:AMP-dependent synthetase and ligase [Paraphysoderma sedebokerense]|nr:AMP-dependent synthetase and ligase [Paraphysoderma sedebokerense]
MISDVDKQTPVFKSSFPSFSTPKQNLSQFILSQLLRHPASKPALEDFVSKKSMTYGELINNVYKLAAGAAKEGAKKGDVWAIVSPNSIEFPIVTLAAGLLGVTVAMNNPLNTAAEIASLWKDCKPSKIFTIQPLLALVEKAVDILSAPTTPSIYLTSGKPETDSSVKALSALYLDSARPTAVQTDPQNDVMFLCFSSGTTGKSKAVQLTHYNIVANVCQLLAMEYQDFHRPNDVFDAILPFFHIYGLTVILYIGLYLGNLLVTLPKFDFVQYLTMVQQKRVSMSHIAPPIITALAKHPVVEKFDLSSLRAITSGAAPLGEDVHKLCMERLSVPIRQGYGMTEMSPVSHINLISSVKMGSVGSVVPNCECKIVRSNGERVNWGESGELCIKGPNIMKGYLNNAKATGETIDQDGFLHTGDIATVDDDGCFYIVDRLKELIKYKGYQVPPAELESTLLAHSAIADSAVIGVPAPDGAGELPKAFVVLKPNAVPVNEDDESRLKDEIMQFVASKVAPYKKVRVLEFVESIPKSASGKILRRLLKPSAEE